MQGVSFSCILGLKELDDSSVTLSLTYWCGNNAWAAAALCFGLEDRRGRHRLTPHNFCERHPAECGVPFTMPRRNPKNAVLCTMPTELSKKLG